MQKLITRKQNRLKHYDYSLDGYYFVTICTINRENIRHEIKSIRDYAKPHSWHNCNSM